MTNRVTAARADWSIQKLATFFTDNGISGAPVLSSVGTVIGVVSRTDLARYAQEGMAVPQPSDEPPAYYLDDDTHQSRRNAPPASGQSAETTVRNIMTPALLTVEEGAPIRDIAERMVQGQLHRLLVVRSGTKRDVVGVVTATDVLEWIHNQYLAPAVLN